MPIKRHYKLIRLKKIRAMIAQKSKFQCRYDLVGFAADGRPRYTCIYLVKDDEGVLEEKILTSDRISDNGVEERIFSLWPALIKHHHEYGDGTDISLDRDFIITTGKQRGCNDVPPKRESND